jgi:transcriptional regulator with XRE-family HTH domain
MPNDADRAGTPAGVFGAELRFYRTRAGLSQKDHLAALVHVSNDVISKIETGERPPAEDFPPRLDAIPELDTRGALTRLWDHPEEGPEAAPVRLVPAVGRHRSPGHGPALVRAACRPRPAPD